MESVITTIEHVEKFLSDFNTKTRVFGIIFRVDRDKNINTLLKLEASAEQREKIVTALCAEDYSEGPVPDTLHHVAEMWVFGKKFKKEEIYIKISMGYPGSNTICISFHVAEHSMNYPFKNKKK